MSQVAEYVCGLKQSRQVIVLAISSFKQLGEKTTCNLYKMAVYRVKIKIK